MLHQAPDATTADRLLYLRALDPEGPLSLGGLDAIAFDQEPGNASVEELAAEAHRWGAAEATRFREELGEKVADESVVHCLLLNCAPLALVAGAWLQWMSSAANGDTGLALDVLSLYACDLGVGHPHADRGSAFRATLAHHRLPLDTGGMHLTSHDRVQNFSFRLPALLMAMSRQPDRYTPELLGADLFLRAVGTPPPLAVLPASALGPMTAQDLDLGSARTPARPGTPAEPSPPSALERSLAAARRPPADRLRRGFHWAAGEYGRWCALVLREAGPAGYPEYDVWRLLFSRARQAAVYHGRFRLAGRPLAEWFADIEAGPGDFLDALAASPLVRPGDPDRSPLVKGLISETGPMFRVFTDEEVAAIRRWILRLPTAAPPGPDGRDPDGNVGGRGPDEARRRDLDDVQRTWLRHTAGNSAQPPDGPLPGSPGSPRSLGSPRSPRSPRDAYHRLLTRQDSPALRRFAHDCVRRRLARSAYRLDAAPHQLPAHWDREQGLSPWLLAEHDRHGEEFTGTDRRTPVPTRAELISSTLQLAPLIMIDGAWLQGFTDYRLASSPVGHLLFRTYWDELGNGVPALNHPRIYRALLSQMGHDLPPTASAAFAEWSGFHDDSFDLPVFWLSISRFPRTFQPEILGLNLAMELSGVGGSYRSARVALKKYGFSTQFVDLHNTIDNVATGHSAWAAEAVDRFMEQIPGVLGPGAEHRMWRRVRIGYRSLTAPRTLGAALRSRIRTRRATTVPSLPPPPEGADPR
ncbi:iron-containing redox enzyme family protein [Streptomyces sp. NPDC091377]|uniref:iron-containing redox enzyme family protein n=1 Tax=Streptomyces sp. NPDC091377 TaxID=3365995 RepID=UPI00382CAF20